MTAPVLYQNNGRAQLNTLADDVTDWFNCERVAVFCAQLDWTAIAATTGEFFLEGTVSIVSPLSDVLRFSNADVEWWIESAGVLVLGGSPTIVAATAGSGLLVVKNPMPQMRVAYVAGGGGGATQVQAFLYGRSPAG